MENKEKQINLDIPVPETFERIVRLDFDFREVWSYIRPTFLYQKLLGYPKSIRTAFRKENPKALALKADVERLQDQIIDEGLMKAKAIYQFFKCGSENEDIFIKTTDNSEVVLSFPRQKKEPYLCLSDYITKSDDTIGFLVVTAGHEILDYAKKIEFEGSFKDAFILQGLAIATAEALAEIIHRKMRVIWGIEEAIPKDQEIEPPRRFRGNRYSFGYPSCPNMEDQQIIWDLLKPGEIGISLTESFMMDPEVSVSAIVFHNPEAKYFNV